MLKSLATFDNLRHLKVEGGCRKCYDTLYSELWNHLTQDQLSQILTLDLGWMLSIGEEQMASLTSLQELSINADGQGSAFWVKHGQKAVEDILSNLGHQLRKLKIMSRIKGRKYREYPWNLLANCTSLTHLSLAISDVRCWNAVAAIPTLKSLALTFDDLERTLVSYTSDLQPTTSWDLRELELRGEYKIKHQKT